MKIYLAGPFFNEEEIRNIEKAEEILYSAEQKLKFLEKFTQIRNDFSEIENILNVQNFDKAKILKITQKYKLD